MINNTKSINKIPVTKRIGEKLLFSEFLNKQVQSLIQAFDELIEKGDYMIEVNNKPFFYLPYDHIMLVNPKKKIMDRHKYVSIDELNCSGMEEWIAQKYFYELRDKNPIIADNYKIYHDTYTRKETYSNCIYCSDTKNHLYMSNGEKVYRSIDDGRTIKIPCYLLKPLEIESPLFFMLEHDFNVFADNKMSIVFATVANIMKKGYVQIDNGTILIDITSDREYDELRNECEKTGLLHYYNAEEFVSLLQGDGFILSNELKEIILNELLDIDKKRVNMESYPAHILKDPESGHWELWNDNAAKVYVNIGDSVVARNPVYDALQNKSGVVGIDFGTKSTVVTYKQSRADVLPMRIGSGRFSRTVTKHDYENPTVIEFRNIEKFIYEYEQKIGRPDTSWEDILISHEAAEQLKSDQSQGDTFASFFSELKQWASDKTRQVKLRDLKGTELNIPSYLSMKENDFDPIEIYAYYLGLFINNMIHGIYLRYKLSFPATVEKKVRDKILDSFTKGIKKSLPEQVLEDETCMKIFKIEQGASEPAAYAITALQEFGFDPEDDEKVYYGIFDFGGGTTDFDFGVYSSEINEPENYDYQISHFGQGGDPYLGGENLLRIMAYYVFMSNYDKLLNDKIVFVRPFGERVVAGKDYLVAQDSQYAHFNEKRLMEKLRGVWEGNEEVRSEVSAGTIQLSLFSIDGTVNQSYIIDVDIKELDCLIQERIEKGVSQFFDALKNTFGVSKNQADLHNVNEMNIFLAGNSSKSPMVYSIFKKYIDKFTSGLCEQSEEKKDWFKIYPPLGTIQADAIIKGSLSPRIDDIIDDLINNIVSGGEEDLYEADEIDNFSIEDLQKPTGKTGVAYGLLDNRVRVVQNEMEEIGFRYYIGQNRKKKFYCMIDKDNQNYNEWVKFCTASKEEFDIWFTRSATAPTNKVPINQIGIYSEIGFVSEPTDNKYVYIRLVSPTDIEYIVSTEEDIVKENYSESEIEMISLQEKQ